MSNFAFYHNIFYKSPTAEVSESECMLGKVKITGSNSIIVKTLVEHYDPVVDN